MPFDNEGAQAMCDVPAARRPHVRWGRLFCSFACTAISLLLPVSPAFGDVLWWPGFRGLSRQGESATTDCPSRWSANEKVRWKTPIPGRGFSSPIATADNVYVTTAYPTTRGESLDRTLHYLVFFLCLLVMLVGTCSVGQFSNSRQSGEPSVPDLLRTAAFYVALTAVAGILLLAEKALKVEQSNIRAWLSSSIVVSLCFALSAFRLPAICVRLALGTLVVAFGVFVVLGMPAKEQAFRSGLGSANLAVVLAVTAFPLAVGALLLVDCLAKYRFALAGCNGARPSRPVRWGLGAGALVLLLCLGFIAMPLIRGGYTPDLRGTDADHTSVLEWWPVSVSSALFGLALLFRLLLSSSWFWNLTLTGSAVLLAWAAGMTLVQQVARWSPYLTYHLGRPKYEPVFGWGAIAIFAVTWVVGSVGGTLAARRRPNKAIAFHLSAGFRIGVLLLAVVAFVHTNYVRPTQEFVRAIVCLDLSSGAIKWTCEGLASAEPQRDSHNSPATPTPVTDGEQVYAYFGTAGLMCCDLKGNLLWVHRNLPYESVYGVGTSPVVCERIVVIASDMPKEWGYLWGLDANTGSLLWTKRWPGNPRRLSGNSRTPVVESIKDRRVVLVWRDGNLSAYELQSGEQVWSHSYPTGRSSDSVASLASDHKRVYLSETAGTMALDLDKLAAGEMAVLWEHRGTGANVSSPVLARGLLFLVTDGGIASCLDAATGDVLWRQRLKGQYYASLVASNKFVYFLNSTGLTTVVACDRTFRKIAENDLGEDSFASIAPLENQLLIRTIDHLYCITR